MTLKTSFKLWWSRRSLGEQQNCLKWDLLIKLIAVSSNCKTWRTLLTVVNLETKSMVFHSSFKPKNTQNSNLWQTLSPEILKAAPDYLSKHLHKSLTEWKLTWKARCLAGPPLSSTLRREVTPWAKKTFNVCKTRTRESWRSKRRRNDC